jgi:hypothetical protein
MWNMIVSQAKTGAPGRYQPSPFLTGKQKELKQRHLDKHDLSRQDTNETETEVSDEMTNEPDEMTDERSGETSGGNQQENSQNLQNSQNPQDNICAGKTSHKDARRQQPAMTLQEAVVWAEILGDPVSIKRRKKRMGQIYGNQGYAGRR